jgi:hypothetical protein
LDRRSDIAMAVAVAGYGALLFFLTTRMETGVLFDAVGKQGLPYFTGAFMFVLGSIVVFKRLRTWKEEPSNIVYHEGSEDEEGYPVSAVRAFVVIGLTFGYIAAFMYLGYLIATPIFLVAGLIALNVRSWPVLVLTPVLYTIVTFWVFAAFLRVRLPLGPLQQFFRDIGVLDLIR